MQRLLAGLLLIGITGCRDDTGPLQLHLTAHEDGSLKQVSLNQRDIGNDDDSFEEIGLAVQQMSDDEDTTSNPERQVDIIADENLRFEFVHRAIEECVGHPATNTEADRGPIPKVRLFDPRAESEEDYPLGFFLYVPSQGEWADDAALPPLKLRLAANADGSLKGLTFGTRNLGDDERAFERLNLEMLKIIGRPDDVIMRELSVSIDADKSLPYQHVIEAIEACFGRLSEQSSRRGIYLKRIGFSGIGEWTAP